jgi:hypothetical protein
MHGGHVRSECDDTLTTTEDTLRKEYSSTKE